jgi:hypothetical protein
MPASGPPRGVRSTAETRVVAAPQHDQRGFDIALQVVDAFGAAVLAAGQLPSEHEAAALLAASAALPHGSPALHPAGRSANPAAAPTPFAADATTKPASARFRLKQPGRLSIPETPADGRTVALASAPPMMTLNEGLRLEPSELRELPLSARSVLSIESYSSC